MNRHRIRSILRFAGYSILLLLVVLLVKILVPHYYDAPEVKKRESTKYWDLPGGSRIGYTMIPGLGQRKPYPVIYLHGGPGGPIYDGHIRILTPLAEKGYDVYLYDQVGCGQSGVLEDIEDYTAMRHKKDLEEIVHKIGAEKIIVIGQSWGAILATLFAADNPGKVEKIVFTGPGPLLPWSLNFADVMPPDSLHLIKPVVSNQDGFRQVQTLRSSAIMYWARITGCRLATEREANGFYWTLTNQTNKAMVCDTSKALRAVPGMGFYSWLMTTNSFRDVEDVRPKLRGTQIPVLILKAQCDNQVWGIIPEYLELFKNHQLKIIPGAGHGIWIEQPELYLEAVSAFL